MISNSFYWLDSLPTTPNRPVLSPLPSKLSVLSHTLGSSSTLARINELDEPEQSGLDDSFIPSVTTSTETQAPLVPPDIPAPAFVIPTANDSMALAAVVSSLQPPDPLLALRCSSPLPQSPTAGTFQVKECSDDTAGPSVHEGPPNGNILDQHRHPKLPKSTNVIGLLFTDNSTSEPAEPVSVVPLTYYLPY